MPLRCISGKSWRMDVKCCVLRNCVGSRRLPMLVFIGALLQVMMLLFYGVPKQVRSVGYFVSLFHLRFTMLFLYHWVQLRRLLRSAPLLRMMPS